MAKFLREFRNGCHFKFLANFQRIGLQALPHSRNKLAYSTVFNLYLMLNLLHQNMVPLPIFYSIVSNDWPIRPQSGHSLPSLLTPSLSPLFQFLLCHQTRWCKLYGFKVPSFLIIQDNASENSEIQTITIELSNPAAHAETLLWEWMSMHWNWLIYYPINSNNVAWKGMADGCGSPRPNIRTNQTASLHNLLPS